MKFLCLFSPIISGILVTFHLVESLSFYHDDYLLFYYRYCSNINFSLLEMSTFSVTIKIVTCLSVLSLTAELCCHIVIYKKKTNIESRAQVYEVRGYQLVSQMRHQRNMVSIFGHFLTFSVILGRNIAFVIIVYIVTDVTLLLRMQSLLIFLDPCIVFGVCPFIETMSSSSLRNSLFSLPQLW